MKSRRSLPLALAILVLTALGLGGAASAGATHAPTRVTARITQGGLNTVDVLAQWGFGDPQNSYAWAMGWFQGKLYVGTGRDVVCVEKATTDFYYPFADVYKTHPEPSVHCPRNPYSMDLRAEIWQYTPQTQRWRMVYQAPNNVPNPRAPGKFISPIIAFRQISVVTDPHGRQVMFASGVSADEYIPELAINHPPQLLRSYDGIHFQNVVSSSFIVHRTGVFHDTRPMGFRGIVQWRGELYVLASTGLTGDGAVFRIDNPWGNRARFVQVSPPGLYVFELSTFDNNLYLGIGDEQHGYSVWETTRNRPPYHFKALVVDGAGRGQGMTSVIAMQPYRGWLYVAAVGWYCVNCNTLPTTELIRIAPDGHWQVVVGAGRFVPQASEHKYPISGLGDGFDNIFNSHMWRMTVSGGALYVGTLDWSWLLQNDKSFANGYPGLLESLLTGEMGFDLWATCNGTDFFPATRNAFGVDMYDFGVRTAVGVNGGVYIGSADHAHGTRIYWQPSNACSPFIQPANGGLASARAAVAAAPPAAPQGLLTDAQRAGTVLSWEPSARATRYVVMRSQQDWGVVPFSFEPPIPDPGGFLYNEDGPIPVATGTAGSVGATLQFPSSYSPVGTTVNTYFVDRTRRPGVKYTYQVVAESTSGAQSLGSNVQFVPDPRPAATFGQLLGLLGKSGSVMARAASGHASCRQTLAQLGALAHTTNHPDVQLLAYRLERRLEYRNVAGGPTTGSLTCG